MTIDGVSHYQANVAEQENERVNLALKGDIYIKLCDLRISRAARCGDLTVADPACLRYSRQLQYADVPMLSIQVPDFLDRGGKRLS